LQIQAVAHCLLNPHVRTKGLEVPQFRPQGSLIQLPCPEALYLGLDRWAVTRNQLEIPEFLRFCKSLVVHYADLMEMMAHQGHVINIVGVAGSPSCGILTTSVGYEEEEFESRLIGTFPEEACSCRSWSVSLSEGEWNSNAKRQSRQKLTFRD